MVTAEQVAAGMNRHAGITASAFRNTAATATDQCWCKAAPIEKNQNLAVTRDIFFDGREHRLYEMPYNEPDGVHRNLWGMTAMMIYRVYQRSFNYEA